MSLNLVKLIDSTNIRKLAGFICDGCLTSRSLCRGMKYMYFGEDHKLSCSYKISKLDKLRKIGVI